MGGTAARTAQSDATVADGMTYCYAVFVIDSQERASAPATVTVDTPASTFGGASSTGQ